MSLPSRSERVQAGQAGSVRRDSRQGPFPIDAPNATAGVGPPIVIRSGQTTFRPRARLIRLLGEELISDEVMAISELVKNAYDADATVVTVRLVNARDPSNGWIEIRDDGCGMSLQTLLDAWLEPATSFKRNGAGKKRTGRGRYPLGEKGVGRFAADKLGAELDLISRATDSNEEIRIRISWERFVEGDYLDEIQNRWEVRSPEEFVGSSHGTLLRIRQLRASWDRPLLERTQQGLSRLISPSARAGDFVVFLEAPDYPDLSGSVRTRLLETAPYRISGTITAEGLLQFDDRRAEPLDLREHAGDHFRTHRGRRLRRPVCGPFSISLSVWDLDVLGSAELRLSRALRGLLRRSSGVSIYRDTFRVAPYGDRGDDWLELNQRRVNNPTMRVSTNQIVGTVEITQETNPDLRDRTSREGLIDTSAFRDLRALTLAALSILEEERYASRKAAVPKLAEAGGDPVIALLESARADGRSGQALKSAMDAYRRYKQEAERRERILLRLASAGAAAETLLGQLNGSVASLVRVLPLLQRRLGDSGQLDRTVCHLNLVAQQLDSLERLRSGATSQLMRVDLRSLAQDAATMYAPLLETTSVELLVIAPSGIIVQTDRSLSLQALLHVVENAIFAAAGMSQHRWVELEATESPPRLIIRDSGYGIPSERQELIFDPFFTTREGHDGLGLFFARTLMRSAGHDLVVGSNGDEFHLVFARRSE